MKQYRSLSIPSFDVMFLIFDYDAGDSNREVWSSFIVFLPLIKILSLFFYLQKIKSLWMIMMLMMNLLLMLLDFIPSNPNFTFFSLFEYLGQILLL